MIKNFDDDFGNIIRPRTNAKNNNSATAESETKAVKATEPPKAKKKATKSVLPPKKEKEEKKKILLSLPINLYDTISAAAEDSGYSVTAYIRYILTQAMK